MLRGIRSTITLIFLCALLAGAAFWGWDAATEPLPEADDLPLCEDEPVETGQKVYPDQVTVSVYNASSRTGLASRTAQLFLDEGFAAGQDGNAPRGTTVTYAQIWTSDPMSPAVRLVKSFLGPRATVVEGEGFEELVRGKKWASAKQAGFICSPPGSSDE